MDPLSDIPGWFDFPDLYDRVVKESPPGSLLVEVGVFMGRSLAHLARAAKKADKGLRVVGVDWCRGSPELMGMLQELPYRNLAGAALDHLIRHGLADDVSLIVADSAQASKLFGGMSAHFVFIDGAHEREAVLRDLKAWGPVVTPGGVIAGHDFYYPSVQAAVKEYLGVCRQSSVSPSCWEHHV